jgi:hypothetical protein
MHGHLNTFRPEQVVRFICPFDARGKNQVLVSCAERFPYQITVVASGRGIVTQIWTKKLPSTRRSYWPEACPGQLGKIGTGAVLRRRDGCPFDRTSRRNTGRIKLFMYLN